VSIAEELRADVEVVLYIKAPPDADALRAVIAVLEDSPQDLVRRDSTWTKLGLTDDDIATPEQIVEVLVAHKTLLQRPLLVSDSRAIIGRPKERVREFLGG